MTNLNPYADISTHTPLARRDYDAKNPNDVATISTHTPLARRDVVENLGQQELNYFYSHAPCEA